MTIAVLVVLTAQQKAYLLSSSSGFYNYRQNANVFKVYHHLRSFGFSHSDILLSYAENAGFSDKNFLFPALSFYDNDDTNINADVEQDFGYSDINARQVFDAIRGKHSRYQLNKDKLHNYFDQKQPLFVYVTGHGGDYYFKVREREALTAEHFTRLFLDLSYRNPYSSILLLSDSCSAITPFEDIHIDNFTALGSSSLNEKSSSHGFDSLINAPKSDDFTFYFDEFIREKGGVSKSIKSLEEYMDYSKLKVHSKLIGRPKRPGNLPLSNYIKKDQGLTYAKRARMLGLPLNLKLSIQPNSEKLNKPAMR